MSNVAEAPNIAAQHPEIVKRLTDSARQVREETPPSDLNSIRAIGLSAMKQIPTRLTALLLAPPAALHAKRNLPEAPRFGKLMPCFSKPWKNTPH